MENRERRSRNGESGMKVSEWRIRNEGTPSRNGKPTERGIGMQSDELDLVYIELLIIEFTCSGFYANP